MWDIGGNVRNTVADAYSTLSMNPAIASSGFGEFSSATNFPTSGVNRLNFAPLAAYMSSQNVGQFWGGSGGAVLRVSDNLSSLSMSPAIGTAAWGEYSNTSNFPVSGVNRLNFAPSGSYNSSQNTGQLYGSSAGAVLRGGAWGDSSTGGLFTAALSNGPTDVSVSLGFRCAFVP